MKTMKIKSIICMFLAAVCVAQPVTMHAGVWNWFTGKPLVQKNFWSRLNWKKVAVLGGGALATVAVAYGVYSAYLWCFKYMNNKSKFTATGPHVVRALVPDFVDQSNGAGQQQGPLQPAVEQLSSNAGQVNAQQSEATLRRASLDTNAGDRNRSQLAQVQPPQTQLIGGQEQQASSSSQTAQQQPTESPQAKVTGEEGDAELFFYAASESQEQLPLDSATSASSTDSEVSVGAQPEQQASSSQQPTVVRVNPETLLKELGGLQEKISAKKEELKGVEEQLGDLQQKIAVDAGSIQSLKAELGGVKKQLEDALQQQPTVAVVEPEPVVDADEVESLVNHAKCFIAKQGSEWVNWFDTDNLYEQKIAAKDIKFLAMLKHDNNYVLRQLADIEQRLASDMQSAEDVKKARFVAWHERASQMHKSFAARYMKAGLLSQNN